LALTNVKFNMHTTTNISSTGSNSRMVVPLNPCGKEIQMSWF